MSKRFSLIALAPCLLIAFIVLSAWPVPDSVGASSPSIWIDNAELLVTDSPELVTSYTSYINQDCLPTWFKIRRYDYVLGLKLPGLDYFDRVCALQTPLGLVGNTPTGTYIKFLGASYAQQLVSPGGAGLFADPVPSTKTLVVKHGTSTSYSPYKTSVFYNILGVGNSQKVGIERKFVVNTIPPHFVDESNQTLNFRHTAYSANGQWMIAVVNNVLMRINVQTKAKQTFAKGYSGGGLNYALAISNDGRYVLAEPIALSDGQVVIYDLSTCQANQSHTLSENIVAGCSKRDITPDLKANISGFKSLIGVRFSFDGQILTGVGRYKKPGDTIFPSGLTHLRINRADYIEPDVQYLALGDSFSSGEGDTDSTRWYEPGTDTDPNKCHISRRGYPYLVAEGLGLHNGPNKTPLQESVFHSVACAGAIAEDITRLQEEDYEGQAKDGLKRGDRNDKEILANYTTGLLAQLEFVEKYKPSSVTLSVIGNDIGFTNKLKICLLGRTDCYRFYEDRLEIMEEIRGQFDTLTSLYQKIRQVSPATKVYVLGYPQLFSTTRNCDSNVYLSQNERKMSRGLVHYLNQTIKSAAEFAGVVYIDVENAFSGKELCDGKSETLAINGLTLGTDAGLGPFKAIGNESFHPNPNGHILLTKEVIAKSDSFSMPMPTPSPETTAPDPFGLRFAEFLDAPKLSRRIDRIIYRESVIADVVFNEQSQTAQVPGLTPLEDYEVYIKSDPVHLGSFRANSEGVLELDFVIPKSIPPGFHTLHIFGLNLAGESINMYKTFYLATSKTDYDGDGIPNTEDVCLIVDSAGIDQDRDGIDDACDGFVGSPVEKTEKPLPNNPETVAGPNQLLKILSTNSSDTFHTAQHSSSSSQVDSNYDGVASPTSVLASTNNQQSDNDSPLASQPKSNGFTSKERGRNLFLLVVVVLPLIGFALVIAFRNRRATS